MRTSEWIERHDFTQRRKCHDATECADREPLPHLRAARPRGGEARFATRRALALAYWLVSGMECLRKGAGEQGSGGSQRWRQAGIGDIDGGGALRFVSALPLIGQGPAHMSDLVSPHY